MTADIHRPLLHQYDGPSGGTTTKMMSTKLPSHSSSTRRMPLQARDPNNAGIAGSFQSSSNGDDEYNSKEMAALNRLSTLESSNNENNKRVSANSASNSYAAGNGSGHIRRNTSGGSDRDNSNANPAGSSTAVAGVVGHSSSMGPGSAPTRSSSVPKPHLGPRSSSHNAAIAMDEDSVMIEEKRKRVNGEGFTLHRYLRGRLLGKGGFAKVYLCTALDTNKTYAVKIVPKSNLVKARARQKVRPRDDGTVDYLSRAHLTVLNSYFLR